MQFSYGSGQYIQDSKVYQGQIILSEHKLFLKDEQEELVATFIPLEKIISVQKTSQGILFSVRLSQAMQYKAWIKADKKNSRELVKDIVHRRGLKKRFLTNTWIEVH